MDADVLGLCELDCLETEVSPAIDRSDLDLVGSKRAAKDLL